MKIRVFAILATAFATLSLPVAAHHSGAQYDLSIRNRSWQGTVKEFKPENPHSHIVLEVVAPDGTTKDVPFEGNSTNNMYRRGWRPGDIKVGDKVTINAAPRKDGADGGFILSILMADGRRY